MIKFGSQISKKEQDIINSILEEYIDEYRDFYITQSNFRLFIKENKELLFDSLNKGDKIVFDEEAGIAYVTGWSDKVERKYLKLLVKDLESADKLLNVLFWNIKEDLYIKIKKTNPILSVLQKHDFIFRGNRGREILLLRKYRGENNG